MTAYRATCANCGSINVTQDALADWDERRQTWTVCGVLDNADCNDCGANGDDLIKWLDLPEAGA